MAGEGGSIRRSPLWFLQKCIFWREGGFSLSVLTIFISFLDFLPYPCYKETNDVRI